jgi:hypothetical protein
MPLSLPGERLALVLSRQEYHHRGACRITHGPNEADFENLVNKSVASVRRSLAIMFNVPHDSQP